VGIARALVQRPRLMLADEPVASLDPVTAERVLDLLARICREDGITAIVSLHQVEFARRYAERIVALAADMMRYTSSGPAIKEQLSPQHAGLPQRSPLDTRSPGGFLH
jgi:phosphonate transport system ATP-binding protein